MPFWSINDLVDPAEAVRQIEAIAGAGFGGVFFHPREGLATPFLSEDWFRVFERVVIEASKRGLTVWIYDEDRWPSGFAGGLVSSEKTRYRAKALVMVVDNKSFSGEDIYVVFRCSYDERLLPTRCVRIDSRESSPDHIYLSFVKYTAPPGDPWFSGFSYVDLLDPEVVKRFIDTVYRPYVERFRHYIGKTIPGVFTDEPNIEASRPRFPHWWKRTQVPPRGSRFPVYALPWTDRLPEYFRELNGYDIVERLPELFFDIGDYVKTRYDYWKTVTRLFVEAFTKQIYEWCSERGLLFTGHFLAEDDLLSQLVVGSVMPHYEYMHIPGIDHLGLQIWGSLLTAKQVSSVAGQLGKRRVLSETYGCIGNYGSFGDRKWIGDFLYVLGVNMLNHHLVPYSLRGRRKADYGLNIHWGQPWWRYNRYIEDYFARLSYVLSQGERVVEVLVISPMYSVWSLFSPVNDRGSREVNEKYLGLLRELVRAHIDFEIGDELIIERHGSVERGLFRIGRSLYRYVVVPPVVNIGGRTLGLLREFIEQGGLVVFTERLPGYVDGVARDVSRELRGALVARDSREAVSYIARQELSLVVEGDDYEGEVLTQLRRDGEDLILFIVNTSRERIHRVRVGVKGVYRAERWDLFTGAIESGGVEYRDGRTWLSLRLLPIDSRLYVLRPGRGEREEVSREPVKTGEVLLSGEWSVSLDEKNNLVLDYGRVYIASENRWTDPMPLPRIRDEYMAGRIGEAVLVKTEFYIEEVPDTDIDLVIEKTGSLKRVSVNGVDIDLSRDSGYWIDPSFRVYRVSREVLRRGLNEVVIEVWSSLEPELEPLYIRGRFGVRLEEGGRRPVVTRPVERVYTERGLDLVREGLPFYSGEAVVSKRVVLSRREGERTVLVIEGLSASLAIVRVNKREAGIVIGPYSETDITGLVSDGENIIEIVLVGTLRNVLGPLHREDPVSTGPETFYVIDSTWREEYVLRPLGFRDARIEFYR